RRRCAPPRRGRPRPPRNRRRRTAPRPRRPAPAAPPRCGGSGCSWQSSQGVLLGAVGPGRERLVLAALGEPAAGDALDVVRQLVGGDLEPAHGAAEPGLVAVGRREPAAQVHLVPELAPAQELALETDVGGLDARARVLAAV